MTQLPHTEILLRHRLAFARRGIPTIPAYGKTPIGGIVPNGAHDGTTDPEIIRRQWTLAPSANIAVVTSGLIVLDIDDRNGGDQSLVTLQDKYGPLPRSWGVLTGGGGEHIYYARPETARIRGGNNRLGAGLDVKTGPGSYVIAPPSRHPNGSRYEWRADAHPAETPLSAAPPWLIRLLTPRPVHPPKPFRPRTDDDQRIADALVRIPSDDREVWWRVGAALKSHLGEQGRELWDRWSATSEKFDPKAQERVWRSFRRGGVGIGTIFYYARGAARAA